MKTAWHYMQNGPPKPSAVPILEPQQVRYKHRSPSKRHRDEVRSYLYEEKKRIFKDAEMLNPNPIVGETVAMSESEVLGIRPAEVLRDRRLRYDPILKAFSWFTVYRHPNLRESQRFP